MRTRMLFFIAILGLTHTAAIGQVTVQHGDLSVTLPSEPQPSIVELEDGAKQHHLNLPFPNGAIVIWHQEAHKDVSDREPGLQAGQDAIVKYAAGEVIESKKVELEGHPGRYFIVSVPAKNGECRVGFYYANGKHYQVMAVGAKEFTRSDDVDKMFSSLTFQSAKVAR